MSIATTTYLRVLENERQQNPLPRRKDDIFRPFFRVTIDNRMPEQTNPTDILAGVLRRLAFPEWKSSYSTVNSPWAIEVPAGFVSFYGVRQGRVNISLDGERRKLTLKANDFCLLPRGIQHMTFEQNGTSPVAMQDFIRGPNSGSGTPVERGPTEFVQAHFPLLSMGQAFFNGMLPEVIQIDASQSGELARAVSVFPWLADEVRAANDGADAMVDRITQTMCVQFLRAYILRQQGDEKSSNSDEARWLRAVLNPVIGPVLGLIHTKPEHPWTVKGLAKHSCMAKSAFSERFREVVGRPPLHYVTECRMQRACEMLRDTEIDVKKIASQVGYESASSFSNAFKRLVGVSPAEYRKSNTPQEANVK